MAGSIPGYDQDATGENRRYSVAAVFAALVETEAPDALRAVGFAAADAWAYFLVLDALVANTDRHHMNWGVIESPEGRRVLAPSFDHGTALGFQVPDEERARRLRDDEVESWCSRGRARTFATRPNLVDLAGQSWTMAQPPAQAVIRHRIFELDLGVIERAISEIPAELMSDCARRFAVEVVRINRRRLLDAFAAASSASGGSSE